MIIPKNFLLFCNIAEIPQHEAVKFWNIVEEDTVEDFLAWVINNANLNIEQLEKLEKVFNRVKKERSVDTIQGIFVLFNSKQKDQAINKFAEIFIEKLENMYDQLGKNMTIEQKQVAKAYIQKLYV